MDGAVMDTAERHREFIAGLTAERPWLQVSKMMRVRWLAAAHEASLPGDIAEMFPVAIPTRCTDGKDTLVDASRLITSGTVSSWLLLRGHLSRYGSLVRGSLVYNIR